MALPQLNRASRPTVGKVKICGAHNIGKTTLAEELKAEPHYQLELSGYEFSENPTADGYQTDTEEKKGQELIEGLF